MNKQLRQEVRERDEHECKFCESEENLHTHHIVPRKAGGSDKKENLMTVCASCHKVIENSQGQALKRIKNEEKKELEQEKERLEEELEDKYSFEELIEATEKGIFHTTLYVVIAHHIASDKPRYEYVGPSRYEAIEELEERDHGTMKKWAVSVDLSEILKKYESKIAEKIDRKS